MKQRCQCNNAKAYCSRHSKVKMVVMLKDEYKNSFTNTVFYSFFKEDKKPKTSIVIAMLKRLKNDFKNAYNTILFYDNITNELIHKHND